jgi:excisionase family DNA binding protein
MQREVVLSTLGPPLKPVDAAAELNVSVWTLYESVKRGEIRALRLGRCLRIPRAEIARLLVGEEVCHE